MRLVHHNHLVAVVFTGLLLGACKPIKTGTLFGQHDSADAGPHSPNGGTQTQDAGTQTQDAGTQTPDEVSSLCWQTRELASDVEGLVFTFDAQGVGHFVFYRNSSLSTMYVGSTRPDDAITPVQAMSGWLKDIAVDSKGQRHVLYSNNYAHEQNGTWTYTPLWDSPFPLESDPITLKLDTHESPHIIFSLGYDTEPLLMYATNRTGEWALTELGLRAIYGWVDLEIDAQGNAHIAYRSNNDVYYATNASGVWVAELIEDFTEDMPLYKPALALDAEDHPHLLYYFGQLQSRHATKREGRWEVLPVNANGNPRDLKVDAAGNLHALMSYSYATLPPGGQHWRISSGISLEAPNPGQVAYLSGFGAALGFDTAGKVRAGYWYTVEDMDEGILGDYAGYAEPCP